jgi:hypothetical protein
MELTAKEIKQKKFERILKLLHEANLLQQELNCGPDISEDLYEVIDHFSDCLKLLKTSG